MGMERDRTNDEHLTGTELEVTMELDVPRPALWEMVQDVTRIGEWSPECFTATWADGAGPQAAAGARFRAQNRFPDGAVRDVQGLVTAAVDATVLEWIVLDHDGAAGSIWR